VLGFASRPREPPPASPAPRARGGGSVGLGFASPTTSGLWLRAIRPPRRRRLALRARRLRSRSRGS